MKISNLRLEHPVQLGGNYYSGFTVDNDIELVNHLYFKITKGDYQVCIPFDRATAFEIAKVTEWEAKSDPCLMEPIKAEGIVTDSNNITNTPSEIEEIKPVKDKVVDDKPKKPRSVSKKPSNRVSKKKQKD